MRSIVAIGLAFAVAVSVAAQAPRRPQDGSTSAPRTIDGHPDLQGMWSYLTSTPRQRPARFANTPFLTEQEAVELEKQIREQTNLDRRAPTAEADLEGPPFNDFWVERGPLARVNGRVASSLIVDPPNGRTPAFTDAWRKRLGTMQEAARKGEEPKAFSTAERCLRNGRPPMYPGTTGEYTLVEIVQTRDHVAIRQEALHETRIVPLDGRPHLSVSIRQWIGDARGRWNGDTLVVESTNFKDLADQFDDNLHLVERFTRVDAETLLYEFTVDDPTVYTRPWSAVIPMKSSQQQLFEAACHEGNYSLANMLKGARFVEQSGASR